MPKQSKKNEGKGKHRGTKVEAVAASADDDFDDMLAEVRAAKVTAEAATSSGRSTSTSSSSTTNQASTATAEEVSKEALVRACVHGDIAQLQRWVRHSIRITSAEPLCIAVQEGKVRPSNVSGTRAWS
jgi:hypothetical protein